jgi:DNA-binding transcriptional ArsR family regulator
MAANTSQPSVSRAVATLIDEGLITLTEPSSGRRAATYRLQQPKTESQTKPTPPGDWTDSLGAELEHLRHDVWRGLPQPHACARVHHLLTEKTPLELLAHTAGLSQRTVRNALSHLRDAGLLARRALRTATCGRVLAAAAAKLGTAGLRARQARLYRGQSLAWAWRCEELEQRAAPQPPAPGSMIARLGRYPVRTDGLFHHAAALQRALALCDADRTFSPPPPQPMLPIAA